MAIPPPRNDLGIVFYQKGSGQVTYNPITGETATSEALTGSYASMVLGAAARTSKLYIGTALGSTFQATVALAGATSIEVRLMGSLDGITYNTPIQTVNGTTGAIAAAHSLTADTILKTADTYALQSCRWEAKATGAIAAGTYVFINGYLGVS